MYYSKAKIALFLYFKWRIIFIRKSYSITKTRKDVGCGGKVAGAGGQAEGGKSVVQIVS